MEENYIKEKDEIVIKLAKKTQKYNQEVGLPFNAHIGEFKEGIRRVYCPKEALDFLNELYEFYLTLTSFEQDLLTYDCLQEGKRFKYWYEKYYSRRMYSCLKNKFLSKLEEKFNEI